MCREFSFPVFVVWERVWGGASWIWAGASGFVVAVFLWLMDDKGAWGWGGGGGGKRSVVWAFSEPRQSSCITNGVFFPGLYQKQCFLYSYVTTIWCKLSILTQCLTTETHLSHMVWLSWGKSRDGSEYLRSHRKLLASRCVCSPSINPKAPPYYIFSSRCLINGLCGEPLLSDAALFLLLTCLLNVSVPPSAYTSH